MATLTGTSLTLVDTLNNTSATRLAGSAQIATAEIGGTTFVYIAASSDDALQVATLSPDGQLTATGFIEDDATLNLDGAFALETYTVGTVQTLAVMSLDDPSGTYFYPTASDPATWMNSNEYFGNEVFDLEYIPLSGSGYMLLWTGFDTDRVYGNVSFPTGGGVSGVFLSDTSNLELDGASGLTSFSIGASTFLAVAGQVDDGVSFFSVNTATVGLTGVFDYDGAANGTLNGPRFLASHVVGDTAYLFVPELNDDAITVLAFDGTTATQVERFTSSLALDQANHANIIEMGDRVLLALTAFGTDALQIFEVDVRPFSPTQGQLTHLQTIAEGTGQGALDGVYTTEEVTIGDTTYLLVSASTSAAVNVYEIGGGDDRITGTVAGDEIFGGSGDDTLEGGSGDDDLEGGSGVDVLEGGSGDDLIRGGDGSDRGWGGSGADTLSGNDGEDTLRGSDDDDLLFGGNDADVLAGNAGDDYLRGGNGDDMVFGGTGNDDLDGEAGHDTVEGGLGDDLMRGGTGDDLLTGSRGADTLVGNAGNDEIFGGADGDTIIGGTGTDTMSGESGADTFVFSNVNQSIHGATRDTITDFEAGVDTIDLSGFSGTLSFVSAYTGAGNEVRYNGAIGRLYVDIDGGASDFSLDLSGAPELTASDLIL